ncbi:MAG: uroporphyrinogen-III synthase [Hyphomonadaceae bacterium]|nr:uroporphyrinogen-III synthase [Hyphomonadaceae bacterium]
MLRIAITRAQPEAEKTAARVKQSGAEPVLAPLLSIEPRQFDTNIADAQALLFTSSNGVHGFAGQTGARNVAVFAVGESTAAAARAAGFADVRSADGDVVALAKLVQASLDPHAGALIHISGRHIAGDLAQSLRAAGFQVERRIAYEAVAATRLPKAFEAPLDVVLFHSARAAEVFVRLGAEKAAGLRAACFSAAVAQAASAAPWAALAVAKAPREQALIEAALGLSSP